jgi:lipopolysaccharide export system protein LptA
MRPTSWIFLTLWLIAPGVQALDTDKDQPIQVQADRIEANQQTGVVTYRGHVHFARGDIDIHADSVEVRQHGEALHSILASGTPVRFHQRDTQAGKEIRGTAARVDYRADRREITLTGEARLEQNGDVFEAATVHYRLDEGDVRAEGGAGQQRVQALLTPRRAQPTEAAP